MYATKEDNKSSVSDPAMNSVSYNKDLADKTSSLALNVTGAINHFF